MSRAVHNEVVRMDMDPTLFAKGVSKALKHISELKKAFNFDPALKELSELDKASGDVDFDSMSRSIDGINGKLTAMGVIGATVISNMTTALMSSVKNMVDTTITGPMKKGFQEYEIQMNAIQTILANTSMKGTVLEDVVGALDELNKYADLTIYNFTEMTRNIGTFTAAGVDLDVSVQAIKGIANLAAVSGSNSQQASTAMYQLSQALASGTVKLMDWNSVVNAGMGGQIFQDSLMETARVHGIAIDQMVESDKGFRNTLQRGWLTDDILLETLGKFTGDLNEIELQAMGYTEEQIAGIIEMGEMANDAATKVKTLTQLKDTIGEAIESGWAQTWQIVFGDFDEAKGMFGDIAELFNGVIESSSASRNSLLMWWDAMGGRTVLIETITRALTLVTRVAKWFGDALADVFPRFNAGKLFSITKHINIFVDSFGQGFKAAGRFKSVIRGVASILDIFRMLVVAIVSPIWDLVKGSGDLNENFNGWIANLGDTIFEIRNFIKEGDYFGVMVGNFIEYLKDGASGIGDFLDSLMGLDIMKDITNLLGSASQLDAADMFGAIAYAVAWMVEKVKEAGVGLEELWDQFSSIQVVSEILDIIGSFTYNDFKGFLNDTISKLPNVIAFFSSFGEAIVGVADFLKDLWSAFADSEGIQYILDQLANFSLFGADEDVNDLSSSVDNLNKSFSDSESVFDKFLNMMTDMTPYVNKFRDGAINALKSFGNWLGEAAKQIDFNAAVGLVGTGIIAALLLSIRNLLKEGVSGNWLEAILNPLIGSKSALVTAITETFGALENTIISFQTNIKADTLLKIALAIGVVTASIIALSFLDPVTLATTLAAVGGLLGGLFGATGIMSKINLSGAMQTSLVLMGVSLALLILSKAIRELSDLDPEQIAAALSGIAIGLTELLLAVKVIDTGKDTQMVKRALLIQTLSGSLVILSRAVLEFGQMDSEELKQGLLAITIGLTALASTMRLLALGDNSGLVAASVGIAIISGAMIVLAIAVEKFGKIPFDQMEQGLIAIGLVLIGFSAFVNLTNGKDMIATAASLVIMAAAMGMLATVVGIIGSMGVDTLVKGLLALGVALAIIVVATKTMTTAVTGALAMVIVSGAIYILAMAIEDLGRMDTGEIVKALLAMAAVFVIMGVAGVLLGPLIPVFVGLGLAFALIGVGALALGAGLSLAAIGLIMVAGSATLVAGAIGIIGQALIEVLPGIAAALAEAIVSFVVTIAEAAPRLLEAGTLLILTLLQSITDATPAIIEGVFTMLTTFLQSLSEAAPEFIQTGFDLLIAFLQGIGDNIQEVVATALFIVAEFIRGITEGLPDLVDAAFLFITTFIDAMAAAIDEHTPAMLEAFSRLGRAMIDAIISAITGGIERMVTAIKEVGASAANAFAEAMGIASPSKVMYDLAVFLIDGLVNGIFDGSDRVGTAMAALARNGQNGMSDLLSGLDSNPVFMPTVMPVLDTGNLQDDLTAFNKLFAAPVVAAGIHSDLSDAKAWRDAKKYENDNRDDRGGDLYFEQHNHSPKALNTAEVYRRTKMASADLAKRTKKKD